MTDLPSPLTPGDVATTALPIELSNAARMLAEARSLPELRELRDLGSTLREWARSRQLGIEAENAAAVFILRVERATGRELLRMVRDGERAQRARFIADQPRDGKGRIRKGAKSTLPTLRDLGISASAAANWQRLAQIEDAHFERMVEEAIAPDAAGRRHRIAKKRFYPWPEDHREYGGKVHRDPLTPLFLLRTYADQVIGSSLARLSSEDVTEVGKIGYRLIKAARAVLDQREVDRVRAQ